MTRRLPHPNTTQRHLDTIHHTLDVLDPLELAELRRLAGQSPVPLEEGPGLGHHDGYPPGTDTAPPASGTHADPTWARATASPQADPTGDAICAVFDDLRIMAQAARRIHQRLGYIHGAAQELRGRVASLDADCLCCHRTVAGTRADRIRSGFCAACYEAWRSRQFPDRASFMRQRRRQLADQQRDDGAA